MIADEASRSLGDTGTPRSFPLARIYRDARVSRIYEGTNEINRTYISTRLVKRLKEGVDVSLEASGDSYVSELAGRAIGRLDVTDQVNVGAVSDLLMLTYAEQSARLRALRVGGIACAAAERFTDWANLRAACAYQTVTGESVSLPAPSKGHVDELAEALLSKRAPI